MQFCTIVVLMVVMVFTTNVAGPAKSSFICEYHIINSEANSSPLQERNIKTSFTLEG